ALRFRRGHRPSSCRARFPRGALDLRRHHSGLFVLLVVGGVLVWRRFRVRGLVNTVSNLPNLNALRSNKDGRQQALIAARMLNYVEIVANLPPNSERQLVEQIVSRLSVGAPKRTLYQGDGGIFAWFEEPKAPFGNH